MTNTIAGGPKLTASVKRPLAGWGVFVGVLALVVVPAGISALGALTSVSGCLVECSEPHPDPLQAVLFAVAALFLLVLPVFAGLATARVLTARGWRIILFTAVIITGLVLAVLFVGVTARSVNVG